MDGRTQTLKSARAIDAINGCVRLVVGKIDDERRGAYPTSRSTPARAGGAAEARTRRSAPRRTAPRRAAPRRTARGEDGAKTEISIFRPLRGGSFDARICPVPPSCPRQAPFKTPTTRASYTALVHAAPRPRRRCRYCCPGCHRGAELPSREIARLEQTESGVDHRIITGAPMFSEKMAIAASENYQLKWHSYGAHLHSSVATLLHSESFADVLLATSCGRHVAAHRFVLAACSSYLSHIFQTCHFGANTNAPIIVVLPTEIGYRTLKILIQYMYSGEATVTNDQLEGVLKAGDILRVRGLWRSNTGSSKKENIQSNNQKIDRDKRETSQLAGQIQKIKLVQPTTEKVIENVQQAATACQNNIQSTKPVERKSTEKIEDKTNESETKKDLEEKNNEQSKNKENLETNGKKKKSVSSDVESNKSKSEGGENTELNLELLVKDEPIDWEESIDPSESLTIDHEIDIKPEIVHSADEDGDMEEEEYTPLTCDMCSQTFNRPSDWVRHIEFTHADMTENRRKKRKDDINDDSKDFPPLKCDLCGNMYSTPQEWVRHIQTEHTEEQLALMNNSAPPKPKRVHNHQKLCNICQKEFPSHASMVIHQRTHTGEKPFLCSYCKKGFNVKSNLLRHLRTLHDKYVHPSLYGSNGSTNA